MPTEADRTVGYDAEGVPLFPTHHDRSRRCAGHRGFLEAWAFPDRGGGFEASDVEAPRP